MDVSDISKTSQNNIPDAKYYLVRPKGDMIYVMGDKPDYEKEPFYAKCAGCKLDMQNYLMRNCLCKIDTGEISYDEDNYLYVLDLCPSENTVVCVFGEPNTIQVEPTVTEVLSSDTYKTDMEVAEHYEIFNWHIPMLLDKAPFKKYIQEHLDEFKVGKSKAPSTPGPTKESKGTPVISNRRLLI